MMRRLLLATAILTSLAALSSSPAVAIEEAERLWLVGERAFADGLYPLARRTLERFVERHPTDARAPQAWLMLGKARVTAGELEPGLEALRRVPSSSPPTPLGLEARFWEAEALFRLKRYAEARTAYDDVVRNNAAAPFAPDALYGYGWTELELKQPEAAARAFRDFLQTWPDSGLAPSATYHMARALVELKRLGEAEPLLADFARKYPKHKLVPDAQYLLGWTRLSAGDGKTGYADLRAFVDAYPQHELAPEARTLLAQNVARFGGPAEQQDAYARLMSQSPTPESLAEAASLAERLGKAREQEAALRKLRAQFPDHPLGQRAGFDLAAAAFKRKEWKDAVTLAEAATRSDDEVVRAEAWLLTGESELKLKRYASAEKAFEAVGGVSGADGGVRYRALAGLGLAHEEQKELKAALSAYESVASKSPDPALRDWARERAAAVKSRLPKPAPPARTPARPKAGS
jgi:TolA-binding protein